MAGVKIDLRSPEVRQENGLSNGTVTLPLHHRRTQQEHRDRAETENQILTALYAQGAVMKRLDIARALGRAKSPWLFGILESMVSTGWVVRTQTVGKNGVMVYWYEVAQ